jgi:hypothetical protein
MFSPLPNIPNRVILTVPPGTSASLFGRSEVGHDKSYTKHDNLTRRVHAAMPVARAHLPCSIFCKMIQQRVSA